MVKIILWKRRHHGGGDGGKNCWLGSSPKTLLRSAKEEDEDDDDDNHNESYSTVSMTSFSSSSEESESSDEILSSASDEMRQLLLVDLLQTDLSILTDVITAMKRVGDMVHPAHPKGHKHQLYARDTNGLGNIVVAMNKFCNEEALQTAGCCCIFYLAFDDKNNRTAMAKAGGLKAVVAAMKAFPNSNGIQFAGCGAISKLIVGPPSHPYHHHDHHRDHQTNNTTASAKVGIVVRRPYQPQAVRDVTNQFVLELNGVATMLQAMVTFSKYAGLQSLCCETLDVLASEEEFLDVVVTDQVAAVVSMAKEHHGHYQQQQSQGRNGGGEETCCTAVHQHATRFMLKKYVCMNEAARQECCIYG